MAEKIKFTDGKLVVSDNPIIPFIEGDGIGPDIWNTTKKVIDAGVHKAYDSSKKIEWFEVFAGEKSFDRNGEWLPNDTLDMIREHFVAIKGPLTTPIGGGIRSLNVALRKELDLFACVRPVRWYKGTPSPLKDPSKVNMTIFRENTEDIYAGIEWKNGTKESKKIIELINELGMEGKIRFPDSSSIGIKPISQEGTNRLVHSAIDYALKHNRKTLTLVHKGNIMKFTEGYFKKWGYEYAETHFADQVFTWNQYDKIKESDGKDAADKAQSDALDSGKLLVKDIITDAFFQQILLRPSEYDVIATMNLNGDYISDAAAASVGGIGIAPGANINFDTGHAIFEATHGTAPKYAGLDKVNPSSMILSGALMLEYIGWKEASDLISNGLEKTISSQRVTYDFHRLLDGATLLKCSEFGDEIINNF